MNTDSIILKGCRENNLKDVSLEIPKRKITVFTGVSGSGKSSLVFDTIAQEAGRQLNDSFSFIVRIFLPRYTRPKVDVIENLSAAAVIDQHRIGGNSRSTLGTVTDINTLLRVFFSRFGSPHIGYGNAFSFNEPDGMCPQCQGIGRIAAMDISRAIAMDKSLNTGAILLPGYAPGGVMWSQYAASGFFDPDKPLREYTGSELDLLLYSEPIKRAAGQGTQVRLTYEGLARRFIRQHTQSEGERSKKSTAVFERFSEMVICPRCGGKRYSDRALSSTVKGYTIFDMTDMSIDRMIELLDRLNIPAAKRMTDALILRLRLLSDMGLGYLSLTRETATLSGGESQRVKMVRYLSSSLCDMLYIFDEPSIGMHPKDVGRLNNLLTGLRDKGNTILVVEHDPDVIAIADHIVDMGPKAGSEGGQVMYSGGYDGLLRSGTLTARALRAGRDIKRNTRCTKTWIEGPQSNLHNLRNIRLNVPENLFTVVTGVAGSGKSTLVNHVFAKSVPCITIDQSPVAATRRSNPATFIGVLDDIRKCFADETGMPAGIFSYNSAGACPHCKGSGTVELNLSFMDTVEMPCPMCDGVRFSAEALTHTYCGKSISDVLNMTANEAAKLFDSKRIRDSLRWLEDVGLGYLSLGQPLSTLSGGECQRIKLARELKRHGNIYILDEPTTGLHRTDIDGLLAIINRMVDAGNTVIAIEHNMDVIKSADWLIDLGPGGGDNGGNIVFEGTPQMMLDNYDSVTAEYLRRSI